MPLSTEWPFDNDFWYTLDRGFIPSAANLSSILYRLRDSAQCDELWSNLDEEIEMKGEDVTDVEIMQWKLNKLGIVLRIVRGWKTRFDFRDTGRGYLESFEPRESFEPVDMIMKTHYWTYVSRMQKELRDKLQLATTASNQEGNSQDSNRRRALDYRYTNYTQSDWRANESQVDRGIKQLLNPLERRRWNSNLSMLEKERILLVYHPASDPGSIEEPAPPRESRQRLQAELDKVEMQLGRMCACPTRPSSNDDEYWYLTGVIGRLARERRSYVRRLKALEDTQRNQLTGNIEQRDPSDSIGEFRMLLPQLRTLGIFPPEEHTAIENIVQRLENGQLDSIRLLGALAVHSVTEHGFYQRLVQSLESEQESPDEAEAEQVD
jgi:hypothetical protein